MDKEVCWKIVETLVRDRLVLHHTEAYELFLEKYIHDIVKDQSVLDITTEHGRNIQINFSNITFSTATFIDSNNQIAIMYPKDALQKRLTYSVPAHVDISVTENGETKLFQRQFMGLIPIMVGSKYCNGQSQTNKALKKFVNDPGGYFIIKGNEKLLICQERIVDNRCFASYRQHKKFCFLVELRSNKTMAQMANVFQCMSDGNVIHCQFVNSRNSVPICVLFALFGAKTDKQIMNCIVGPNATAEDLEIYSDAMEGSFREWHEMKKTLLKDEMTVEAYIVSHLTNRQMQLSFLMKNRIIPHVDTTEEKLLYFGFVLRALITFVKSRSKNSIDRDSLQNKKIESCGILMAQLFKKLWKDTYNSLKHQILREKDWNPTENQILKPNTITNRIVTALATGSWDSKISCENKKFGVAQILKRLNDISSLSHLRRINSPISKTGKLIQPRKLHNSQLGYLCCAESPEGAQIGLIKHLCLGAMISSWCMPSIVLDTVSQFDNFEACTLQTLDIRAIIIFINGTIAGQTNEPMKLLKYLRKKRRCGQINFMVSFTYIPGQDHFHISCDEGRLLRPLFVVNEHTINITDNLKQNILTGSAKLLDLLNQGIVEFLDPSEIETVLVAKHWSELKKNDYTHCQIHNALIFGVSASTIPFPEHNQAPRVLYQCAQVQQAIGFNNSNILQRMDTVSHLMHYLQRPIVYTRTSKLFQNNDCTNGSNIVVAICCYGGYNIEDSLIVNQASLERGLFSLTTYRTYKTCLNKEKSILMTDIIGIPNEKDCIQMKNRKCYKSLDKNGIIEKGTVVEENHVLIGKMTPLGHDESFETGGMRYKDTSVQLKEPIAGRVDQVTRTETPNDEIINEIRVRTIRIPEVGDKCCSRHGQKGTIGIILPEQDMPFTEDGVIPDIIINPHCMPSRMTIGQILECVLAKYGASSGQFIDGTPFEKQYDMDSLDQLLLQKGFCGSGKEIMYNGRTGQQILTKIFVGPTYYERLKHMVSDKMHARATGPVNRLTQQPTEGRSRKGGLKLGYMEIDCLHAHGVPHFIYDKTFESSDAFWTRICDKCGQIIIFNEEEKISHCNACGPNHGKKIALPVSTKLLLYELMGMGINVKMSTE